jgi:hypothetical protein
MAPKPSIRSLSDRLINALAPLNTPKYDVIDVFLETKVSLVSIHLLGEEAKECPICFVEYGSKNGKPQKHLFFSRFVTMYSEDAASIAMCGEPPSTVVIAQFVTRTWLPLEV